MNRNILFVCTGNMCRSPMAEYMLRARLAAESPWKVASAGTMAADGLDGSANAVAALKEIGIDMSAHRTRLLTDELTAAADVVVAMTKRHMDEILDVDPSAGEKLFLIRSFDPDADTRDVPDPVGWDLDVYRDTRDSIEGTLAGLMEFMEELEGREGV